MSKDKSAKIKAFKVAFLKPAGPSKEAIKTKTQIEKLVKAARKKTGKEQDAATNAIQLLTNKLAGSDPAYLEELVAYKLTKHWDDPHEFKTWMEFSGSPANLTSAVKKMLGPAPDEEFVKSCWERGNTNPALTQVCFDLAPGAVVKAAVAQIEKTGIPPQLNTPALQSQVVVAIFKKSGADKVPPILRQGLAVNDATEIAQADPAGFAKVFLKDAVPVAKLKFLKNPKIRAALSTDKAAWKELCKTTPILPFLDAVKAKVESQDPDDDELEATTAAAVFDELMSDDGSLPMTYYTNKFTSPNEMMGAPPESTKDRIKLLTNDGKDDTMPTIPAAQCDELVSLLKEAVEGALGPDSKAKCKHIVIPGMVLTVKLSTLPGGLLKNNFGGNVYNDAGTLTGQVLFTGNTDGNQPNSHTYLEVGGVNYDAVLGTTGDAVAAAVADEFEPWDKTDWLTKTDPAKPVWVAKSKTGGNYVVMEEGLKAAPNRNGFKTAYRLTTQIDKYAVPAS